MEKIQIVQARTREELAALGAETVCAELRYVRRRALS